MKFSIVGLGRMGLSLGSLAVERGHHVVWWAPSTDSREQARDCGFDVVERLEDVAGATGDGPRIVLMWVPHGAPVDDSIDVLCGGLKPGDVVADCGNSHWNDSRRRHEALSKRGVQFLDIGTSGGISAAHGWRGAAFMVGGPRTAFDHVAPLLKDLAVDDEAVFYAGESGSGVRAG